MIMKEKENVLKSAQLETAMSPLSFRLAIRHLIVLIAAANNVLIVKKELPFPMFVTNVLEDCLHIYQIVCMNVLNITITMDQQNNAQDVEKTVSIVSTMSIVQPVLEDIKLMTQQENASQYALTDTLTKMIFAILASQTATHVSLLHQI